MLILNTLAHFIKKLSTIKTASEVLHIAFQSQYLTAASGAAFKTQTNNPSADTHLQLLALYV